MRTDKSIRQPERKQPKEEKKSIGSKFSKPTKRVFSFHEYYENWAEVQLEDDISIFTADGPYYEFDEEE